MKQTNKECCWWREKVELALEKGETSLINEAMWNWVRFGELEGPRFKCSFCYEKSIELGKLCNFDLTDKDAIIKNVKILVATEKVKCCEMVRLIDLNDPNHSILGKQVLSFKFQFGGKLCFKCLVKINGILVTVNSNRV